MGSSQWFSGGEQLFNENWFTTINLLLPPLPQECPEPPEVQHEYTELCSITSLFGIFYKTNVKITRDLGIIVIISGVLQINTFCLLHRSMLCSEATQSYHWTQLMTNIAMDLITKNIILCILIISIEAGNYEEHNQQTLGCNSILSFNGVKTVLHCAFKCIRDQEKVCKGFRINQNNCDACIVCTNNGNNINMTGGTMFSAVFNMEKGRVLLNTVKQISIE